MEKDTSASSFHGKPTTYPTNAIRRSSSSRGTTPPAIYSRPNRISCDPCRKLKIKCNRVKPCSNCQKRRVEHTCYRENREGNDDSTVVVSKRQKSSKESLESTIVVETKEILINQDMGQSVPAASYASARLGGGQRRPQSSTNSSGTSTQLEDSFLEPSAEPDPTKLQQHQPFVPLGSGRDGAIVWQDICHHVPSLNECEELIVFYFDELSLYCRIHQRSEYEKWWRRFVDGPGVERHQAAMILTSFALADFMIPPASRSNDFGYNRNDHYRWMRILGDPSSIPLGTSLDSSFEKIQLLAMNSIYHLYTGQTDCLWEYIGITMRKATTFGLFDERSKSWIGIDNLTAEYRRRLAWYMVSMDRWQGVVRQLPFALHPSYVHLAEATFESDSRVQRNRSVCKIVSSTPLILENGLLKSQVSPQRPGIVKFVFVELLAWCHEFLEQFESMDKSTRYSRALLLDKSLEGILLDGLSNTGIKRLELHEYTTTVLDECAKERQTEVNLFISSMMFLRCIITRRFLMDENAPTDLRFISLVYAQGILATIPSLTHIIREGQTPIYTTLNANHLLAAATTFIVVILGRDHYIEYQAEPLELKTSQSTNNNNRKTSSSNNDYPVEQIDWLAENIFSTLDCLETLIQSGNRSAEVAKKLLEKLCGSQDDLRSLHRAHYSKTVQQVQQQPQQTRRRRGGTIAKFPFAWSRHGGEALAIDDAATTLKSSSSALSPTSSSSTFSPNSYPGSLMDPSLQCQTSATSLLDAILMDPTELYMGSNTTYSELLASLMYDTNSNT